MVIRVEVDDNGLTYLFFPVREDVILYQHQIDPERLDLLNDWMVEYFIWNVEIVPVFDKGIERSDSNRRSACREHIFGTLDVAF